MSRLYTTYFNYNVNALRSFCRIIVRLMAM